MDAFFGNLVEIDRTGAFDDWTVPGVRFWGVYATIPFHAALGIRSDIYYLGLINPQVVFNQGPGREECHTMGTRFFGTLGHWDLNDEMIYQFGQFASGEVNAWSIATDHGYRWERCGASPVSVCGSLSPAVTTTKTTPTSKRSIPFLCVATTSPRQDC